MLMQLRASCLCCRRAVVSCYWRHCTTLLIPDPTPALPARLLHDAHSLHHYSLVDALTHVVDGQAGDGGGSKRFHLDTCLALAFYRGGDGDAAESVLR